LALLEFPNPVEWFEGAKNAGLERQEVNAFVSAAYSAWISLMWRSGSAKLIDWSGEGPALKDAATAMYLSLSNLESVNFLCLTVPKDLIDPKNLSNFQTEMRGKP